MNATEKLGINFNLQLAFFWQSNPQVLRPNHHFNRFIWAHPTIHCFKALAVKLNQIVLNHLTWQNIGLANEGCNKVVDGLVININRRPRLNNLAVIHNENPVAHSQGFLLVVRDKDKGNAETLLQFPQLILHICTQLQIQSRQGLIQQDNPRLINDCPRNGYTLSLTARQFANRTALKAFQLNHFQYFSNPLLNFFFINLAQTQRKGNIFKNIHMRKQCIGLKNRVDVSFISRNIIDANTIKKNIAVCRVQKTSNDVQNR